MLQILKIHNLLPADKKWLALFSQKEEPFYFTIPVDFWINCTVLDLEDLKGGHEWLAKRLITHSPIGEDEDKDIIDAYSYPGIFAAQVCDSSTIGDMDIIQGLSNFIRIIEDGTMTPEELTIEAKPPY